MKNEIKDIYKSEILLIVIGMLREKIIKRGKEKIIFKKLNL